MKNALGAAAVPASVSSLVVGTALGARTVRAGAAAPKICSPSVAEASGGRIQARADVGLRIAADAMSVRLLGAKQHRAKRTARPLHHHVLKRLPGALATTPSNCPATRLTPDAGRRSSSPIRWAEQGLGTNGSHR